MHAVLPPKSGLRGAKGRQVPKNTSPAVVYCVCASVCTRAQVWHVCEGALMRCVAVKGRLRGRQRTLGAREHLPHVVSISACVCQHVCLCSVRGVESGMAARGKKVKSRSER